MGDAGHGRRGDRFHDAGPVGSHRVDRVGVGRLVLRRDSGNYRVQQFDRHRKHIRSFGRFGSGDGQFLGQMLLALDDEGRVYASDRTRKDLQVFSPTGKFQRVLGELGQGDGKVGFADGPVVIGDRVFLGDATDGAGSAEVEVFDLEGKPVETIHSPISRARPTRPWDRTG